MDAIRIENLRKSYKNHEVLKDVSLSVKQGEVFTLLGENGAGKTTLIHILATLLHADAGTVTILGESLAEKPDKVRELISLNSQSNTLDEAFSGYENLKLIAELRGVKDVKAEITRISERLNLDSFLKRKVAEYSGGMRRRLDIAMSLVGDPSLIFLDEPTTGVDPKNRIEIWKTIQEIRDSGKTIFLTTQYLEEADRISDHIGFIHDGRIVLSGTPEQVKQKAEKHYLLELDATDFDQGLALLQEGNLSYQLTDKTIELNETVAQEALQILLAKGISVEKFNLAEVSLESIFLHVTGNEGEK
ncbi:ABC transporter [Listeria floridensis FSL S10-1187]|uniref:ABC transporter n=2 Tax=Listeria floridensis TaxID=1494962 RepID=A0ABN0RBI9_9LIST|nr:ABC transporter [Listeria floridensis FSL S10-1187]